MTTIAIKDGILACDSRITVDGHVMGHAKKAEMFNDAIVAVAGDFITIPLILDWVRTGRKGTPKVPKDSEFIITLLDREGRITVYENGFKAMHLDDNVFSTGSGSKYAYGAMHAGATAKQAVIAAASYDGCTGGRVRTYCFDERRVPTRTTTDMDKD